jgi:hypothetical protein
VPGDLARRHAVLPFKLEQGRIYLATANPSDAIGLTELAEHCGQLA